MRGENITFKAKDIRDAIQHVLKPNGSFALVSGKFLLPFVLPPIPSKRLTSR